MVKSRAEERTSSTIASVAGQLLNGRATKEGIAWLEAVVDDPETDEDGRCHAAALLGTFASIRRVAGSALTQR